MGQKSNLITLTKHTTSLNFTNINSKIFIANLRFMFLFELLLKKKNINLFKYNIIMSNNLIFLNIFIFFRSKKIINLKKNKIIIKKNCFIDKYFKIKKLLNVLYGSNRQNLFYLTCHNLNFKINKNLLVLFYNKLKRYRFIYFQRVFNLFIDFIKICSLLCTNLIAGKNFLFFLSLIFKSVSKKLHNRFIYFIKNLFNMIIREALHFSLQNKNLVIKGVKFIVSGRLRDKQRSSFICLQEGLIPISNLKSGVDFSKMHVNTIYGVFGFKLWIFKETI